MPEDSRRIPCTRNRTDTPLLSVARYRLRFQSAQPLRAHGYRGSAWRGVLGHSLKQLSCVTRERECRTCLLYNSCIYPYIFETPPPEGSEKLSKYTAAPHPFLLDLEPDRKPGSDSETVGLTLIGQGIRYLAYLVRALEQAGKRGIRPDNVPLTIVSVEQEDPLGSDTWQRIDDGRGGLAPLSANHAKWPEAPQRARIVFKTPLRLRRENDFITPERLAFADLFSNLLRRCSLLMYFHTDSELETDFAGLVQASKNVAWQERNLRWRDWTRFSGRQKVEMQMGGLVGTVTFASGEWPDFWPYLWLGQWLHAGKGTSMGLGLYEVTPEPA